MTSHCHELPTGFQLPSEYVALLAAATLPDIEPWWFLAETPDLLSFWTVTLQRQYPARSLVPFAKDGGSDDVVCFDGGDRSGAPRVLIIHSFTSPGWEGRWELPGFARWLELAVAEAAAARMVD